MKYLFSLSLLLIIMMSFVGPNSFVVNGTVTDGATGTALRGVIVKIKGTSRQVVTDQQGAFSIKADGAEVTLLFIYKNYSAETREVKAGETNLRIYMNNSPGNYQKNEEAKADMSLSEVVVIGYGATKKRSVTGSVLAPMSSNVIRQMPYNQQHDREGYDAISENTFKSVSEDPLSTFSIDVDAASYSNVRRILNSGQLPDAGAVRIEEMINYFKYKYEQPKNNDPFSFNTEIAACPWNPQHQLVSVGMQGRNISMENLPASNLVFLIDVSGSMEDENKLPLVKQSLKLLVDQLRTKDRVALVVYAGNAGLVLPSTSGEDKIKIKDAIDQLNAGGSTAGGEGIQLAYKTARENFIKSGNNRIILCSDGDFNVGVSSDDALERMIEQERKSGVFLTILGYGMGNYQDAKMQKLADKGNGNHAYIDNFNEARRVLVKEFGGTLFAIAKDVKLQVEFNPAKVQAYRLVGYENRMLAKEDFNDDKKDAGDLGSGHTVTALYEIIPVGVKSEFIKSVDPLKYQKGDTKVVAGGDEMMTIKFRYKQPDGDVSKLITHAVRSGDVTPSENFRFAAAVAQFGMLLRNSEFKQQANFESTLKLAKGALGDDDEGYRSEFVRMVKIAQDLEKGMGVR